MPAARADDPGRKPRGNCHHTKRHTHARRPSRARGPLDAEGPAGIATTLRDAPARIVGSASSIGPCQQAFADEHLSQRGRHPHQHLEILPDGSSQHP